jgi:hypothetical protein
MVRIGLPVPPGFTITTDTSIEYTKLKAAPAGLMEEVREYVGKIEKVMDKGFGNASNPLLLAIRSRSNYFSNYTLVLGSSPITSSIQSVVPIQNRVLRSACVQIWRSRVNAWHDGHSDQLRT